MWLYRGEAGKYEALLDEYCAAIRGMAEHVKGNAKDSLMGVTTLDDFGTARDALNACVEERKAKAKADVDAAKPRERKRLRAAHDEWITELEDALTVVDEALWLTDKFGSGEYVDIPDLCKIATLQEIEEKNRSLTPGAHVGVPPQEDDGVYHKRPDLMGFVNGVPLLFVELKKYDKDVRVAYEKNYSDYEDTVPQLFHFNAFVMLSNGLEARVGTLGSTYEFFHERKRLAEGDAGAIDLDTMLLGMCDRRTFMDPFENFILFDHSGSKTAKILARNHQYLGVNEAVAAYADRKVRGGKLGVFWHAQGSGKSYSMVFFVQKVRQSFEGSPTFVVVMDCEELNRQIAGTFAGCGLLGGTDAKQYIATSGKNLHTRLEGNPSFVFTLIHKFNDPHAEPIIPDHDIVILSDEAHRTNNGTLAQNMVRMLLMNFPHYR